MVFSYYIYNIPYKIIWHVLNLFKKNPEAVVYCADPLDYVVLAPVLKHLPHLPFIVKNKKTAKFLKEKGLNYRHMPSFPGFVIMSRHAAHKFPVKKIVKIGFRHGAYHFKEFTKAANYNAFDLYFVTSENEVNLALQRKILSVKAIGFPKLDPAFDGTLTSDILDNYRKRAKIDPAKKTIIFTATWRKSGMSAIDQWIDHLYYFAETYNVLVTLHPWESSKYRTKLQQTRNIFFIDDPDVLPYLMISDVLIGDTSSIIAEFCALNKPIITFKLPQAKRSIDEIRQLLQEISIQVEEIQELKPTIEKYLRNPQMKKNERQRANLIMFDNLDGKAGRRAAEIIKKFLP